MRNLMFLLLGVIPLWSAPARLWQIGTPDYSHKEFRGGASVVYTIGRSREADWPREQSATIRPVIRFSLPSAPAGRFELRVDLLFRRTALPGFEIVVNGRRGTFALSPETVFPRSADDLNSIPHCGRQRLKVALPARFFRQGANEIGFVVTGLGSVIYDAIELTQDPVASAPPCDALARLVPTVFWRKQNGELVERVDFIVRPGSACGSGSVEAEIAGRSYRYSVPADYAFGDLVFPLQVPDAGAGADAVIGLSLGTRHEELHQRLAPARKWKLYVASTTHLDIGYTARQPDVLNLHEDNTTVALDLMDRYPEFRWNLEGAWLANRFLGERTRREVHRFLQAASTGKLGVSALHSNLQASLLSLEEWNRATELSHELGQRTGAPMDMATVSDVPSLPLELPTVLHDAGIRYLANGANQYRGPILLNRGLDEESPVFWEGPDGSRVLCWFTKAYAYARFLFGIPGTAEQSLATLQYYLKSFPQSYPYDAVLVYGFDGDNGMLSEEGNTGFYRQWNAEYEYPRIIPARFRDFFTYIESQGTRQLPVIRGDGGAYWEDGATECPRATALGRRNQAEAVELETLASLAVMRNPDLRYPTESLRRIWDNILLFDEHTFGRDSAPLRPDWIETKEQWAIKSGYALTASQSLRWGCRQWLSRLAGAGDKAVAVWNPSTWRRSDVVEVEIPGGKSPALTPDGAPLPVEVVKDDGGRKIVRFLAKDIPPLEWRTYPLVSVATDPKVPAASTRSIENEFYKVTFDDRRVGIRSIVEKSTGRELVDPASPYELGEFLRSVETSQVRKFREKDRWDSGIRTTLDVNARDLPEPRLVIQRARPAGGPEIHRTAIGWTARIEGSSVGAPGVGIEVRLWNGIPRIDITERMYKPRVDYGTPEAVYFAFPLRVGEPVFSYDRALGWVDPVTGMMPGSAPEWYAANSAVNIAGPDVAVTLATPDAPMVMFGDINRGRWPAKVAKPGSPVVYSYVYGNYWLTNFPAGQEYGDFEFHYSLTTNRGGRAGQSRFGQEARHPLRALLTAGAAGGAAAPVVIDSPSVRLVTVRQVPDGRGYLVRLAEESGTAGDAVVRFPGYQIRTAHLALTHGKSLGPLKVERGAVRVPLAAFGMATLLVE